jgi:hypothetical protein
MSEQIEQAPVVTPETPTEVPAASENSFSDVPDNFGEGKNEGEKGKQNAEIPKGDDTVAGSSDNEPAAEEEVPAKYMGEFENEAAARSELELMRKKLALYEPYMQQIQQGHVPPPQFQQKPAAAANTDPDSDYRIGLDPKEVDALGLPSDPESMARINNTFGSVIKYAHELARRDMESQLPQLIQVQIQQREMVAYFDGKYPDMKSQAQNVVVAAESLYRYNPQQYSDPKKLLDAAVSIVKQTHGGKKPAAASATPRAKPTRAESGAATASDRRGLVGKEKEAKELMDYMT